MLRTQRATEISYSNFAHHLHTNTIGPIITAQRLLATGLPIGTIVFMSSDSGSALNFRDFEDGFGGYAASKAALNQMLRVCYHSTTTSAPSNPFLPSYPEKSG
jgi:NAD(P)-dependent dehydrogenase (short-subunit alcohol dehydrogenase family)